jgi:hypothetical protein
VTERKDIGARLEAWARWATSRTRGGADCMTGAVCEGMRRAELGDVWSGHTVRDNLDDDTADAIRIQRGMVHLSLQHRLVLNWTYIEQARPEVVCRMCNIPVRPISEFVRIFRDAQAAIEDIVDSGNR